MPRISKNAKKGHGPTRATGRPEAGRSPYLVRDQRQLRALASPVRQAIVDIVAANGPCGTTTIALHLGRPASALYHHVRALQRVGLLTEQPAPPARGRPASLFDVPGRPMMIQYEPTQKRTRIPMRKVVEAMTRAASRDFVRGYRDDVVVTGNRRQLWAARSEAFLDDADLQAVNDLLVPLFQFMQSRTRDPGPNERLHSLTFILAPLGDGSGPRDR